MASLCTSEMLGPTIVPAGRRYPAISVGSVSMRATFWITGRLRMASFATACR